MNGFLIDTNVLSEYSRLEGPDVRVRAWLETAPRELQYVSVLNLAEIQKGIELLDKGKQRRELQNWLATELEDWFSGHILPVDRRVADCWAQIAAGGIKIGRPLPAIDSLIAATAMAHSLTIATRNIRDFQAAGVKVINPWMHEPSSSQS